jgi:hypothetical protein
MLRLLHPVALLLLGGLVLLSGCVMIFPTPHYPIELAVQGIGVRSLNNPLDNRNRWQVQKNSFQKAVTLQINLTKDEVAGLSQKVFYLEVSSKGYKVRLDKTQVSLGETVNLWIEDLYLGGTRVIPKDFERTVIVDVDTKDDSLSLSRIIEVDDVSFR